MSDAIRGLSDRNKSSQPHSCHIEDHVPPCATVWSHSLRAPMCWRLSFEASDHVGSRQTRLGSRPCTPIISDVRDDWGCPMSFSKLCRWRISHSFCKMSCRRPGVVFFHMSVHSNRETSQSTIPEKDQHLLVGDLPIL